jgi:HK97 family phage major capsid protein
VVLSDPVGAGTALVGAFNTAGHIWRRGGLSVEASNSHGSFFAQNSTALRAESRAGLGVFRNTAFTEMRGLTQKACMYSIAQEVGGFPSFPLTFR